MSCNTSELLSQLNSMIEEVYAKETHRKFDFTSIQKAIEDARDPLNKNRSPFFKNNGFREIEERVSKLEKHNDQLVTIIQFMFEKIAELAGLLFELPHNVKEKVKIDHCDSFLTRKKEISATVRKELSLY